MFVLRSIREIKPGMLAQYVAVQEKVAARYAAIGIPRGKRYRQMFGVNTTDTIVVEYEMESLSALETVVEKRNSDSVLQGLRREYDPFVVSQRLELFRAF